VNLKDVYTRIIALIGGTGQCHYNEPIDQHINGNNTAFVCIVSIIR